jgi:hypothetical protein
MQQGYQRRQQNAIAGAIPVLRSRIVCGVCRASILPEGYSVSRMEPMPLEVRVLTRVALPSSTCL